MVMVFGAFDGLHPGHLDFFKQAKKYGDFLIVSVGTDKNVKAIKGKKPLFNQKERLALVASVGLVDKTVLGAEKDFYRQIKKYAPVVICLGYDQNELKNDLKNNIKNGNVPEVRLITLKPHFPQKFKTSILEKLDKNDR